MSLKLKKKVLEWGSGLWPIQLSIFQVVWAHEIRTNTTLRNLIASQNSGQSKMEVLFKMLNGVQSQD